MQTVCSFFARFCISSIFIFTALQELISWNAQERYFYDVLSAIWSSGVWGKVMTETLGWALENFLVVFSAAIFLKLLGGICVLFSWKPKFGSFLLLVFLLPTTVVMHDFWNKSGSSQSQELIDFLKNMAIAGGLFSLLAKEKLSPEKKQPSHGAKDKN